MSKGGTVLRRLMWLTLGVGAACLIGAVAPEALRPLFWAVPVPVVLAGLFCWKWKGLRIPLWVLLGTFLGILWWGGFQEHRLEPLKELDGMEAVLTVQVTTSPETGDYGISADGSFQMGEKQIPVRLYLDGETVLSLGDSVRGAFRLRCTGPGGSRETSYYAGEGTFLLAYQQTDVTVCQGVKLPLRLYPARLRQQIGVLLENLFPEDTVAFARALLLGDTSGLTYETDTALKLSGIRHVVAVSGLHISILYTLISTLTARRRFLTALLGFPALVLLCAVAGFSPSVTRACVMVGLMLLAQLVNREYDSATGLSFAALVMLLRNPLVILSVGFQLSVGCVAGILLFAGPIRTWILGKLPGGEKKNAWWERWLSSGIATCLGAMSLTTPLSAWYFGTVSLVSVLTNLLTLWAVTLVFYGLIGACVIGAFWTVGGRTLAWLLSWVIRYILKTAQALASFPLAAVYTQSQYIVFWLLFVYILLAVFLFQRKKQPVQLLCCGVLGLCAALMLSWTEPAQDDFRLTVLDVGQGQCILADVEGRHFLIDCGGDTDAGTADLAAQTLLSRGITGLDGVILTHYDRDHSGGLGNLLTRVDTKLLLLPATVSEYAIPQTGGEVVWVSEELELALGTAYIRIFPPVFSGYSNENSLCILFHTENCDILITGDRSSFGERMLLRDVSLPQVDVLIAGHHGAADASSEELLRAVRPTAVIISVGENRYGHPAPDTLRRFAEFGCTVFRTDRQGTILFRR